MVNSPIDTIEIFFNLLREHQKLGILEYFYINPYNNSSLFLDLALILSLTHLL